MSAAANTGVSPVRSLRQMLGLTAAEFSKAMGVPAHVIHAVEDGREALPRKARAGLAELGIDTDALVRRQSAWVEARAAALRAALKHTMGGTACAR